MAQQGPQGGNGGAIPQGAKDRIIVSLIPRILPDPMGPARRQRCPADRGTGWVDGDSRDSRRLTTTWGPKGGAESGRGERAAPPGHGYPWGSWVAVLQDDTWLPTSKEGLPPIHSLGTEAFYTSFIR
jgi:hypothetical protein